VFLKAPNKGGLWTFLKERELQ
jgi:hypothetical protein